MNRRETTQEKFKINYMAHLLIIDMLSSTEDTICIWTLEKKIRKIPQDQYKIGVSKFQDLEIKKVFFFSK
jgi:hypothetical protein